MREQATGIGKTETKLAERLKSQPRRARKSLFEERQRSGANLNQQESHALLYLFNLLNKWDQEGRLDGN